MKTRLSYGQCVYLEEMDGWMDEWMDGWVDGWMDGWMNGWMDGWICSWIDSFFFCWFVCSFICSFVVCPASVTPPLISTTHRHVVEHVGRGGGGLNS